MGVSGPIRRLEVSGMERHMGRIWVSVIVASVVVVIVSQGNALRTLETKSGEAPFLIALTQLGILYIIALFVERALEVLIKAWRQGEKIRLEQQRDGTDGSQRADAERALAEYRAGTQKRALLLGLTLGVLVSLAGVRLLGPMFEFDPTAGWAGQERLFHLIDIVITAGLIAGGSSTIHELMALIDDFLKASRRRANQP